MARIRRGTWVAIVACLLVGLTLALIGAKFRLERLSRAMLEGIESGSYAVVRRCLQQGASPNARSSEGFPALTDAVSWGRADIARLLLCHGAQVDAADDFGRTPLMFAAKDGNADCVRLLLEHGADPGLQDVAGLSPTQMAQGHPEIHDLFKTWLQRHGKALLDETEMVEGSQGVDDSSLSP